MPDWGPFMKIPLSLVFPIGLPQGWPGELSVVNTLTMQCVIMHYSVVYIYLVWCRWSHLVLCTCQQCCAQSCGEAARNLPVEVPQVRHQCSRPLQQCTVYNEHCQCTVYSVQYTIYTVSVQCTMYSVHYALYTVQCRLYSIPLKHCKEAVGGQ